MISVNRSYCVTCLVLATGLSGCGNTDGGSNAPAGAAGSGNSPTATGSTSNATGGTGNGGTGSGGTSGGATAKSGYFRLYSFVLDDFNRAAVVSASFGTSQPECSSQTFGQCVVHSTCTQSTEYASAGTLTVTSPATAALAANNLSITPNADNTYTQTGLSGLFSGAESVHIAASGATVPAFAEDLTVPLVLLIDSPTPDADGIIHASTSSDLVIQFSRGTPDVGLSALQLSAGTDSWVECNAVPGANTLTIPHDVWAQGGLPLYLVTRATKDIIVGDFSVNVGVLMNAYIPDRTKRVVVQIN